MKKALTLIFTIALIFAAGCRNENFYDSLPKVVAQFISEYFPNPKISYYDDINSIYKVGVADGPTLVFDKDYKWTTINGNGMPLPQQLLYDQLPTAMYDYLQEIQALNKVFGLTRDSEKYVATLLKSKITYDIASGRITDDLGQ